MPPRRSRTRPSPFVASPPSSCYRGLVPRPPNPPKPSSLAFAAVVFYALMSIGALIGMAVADLDPVHLIFGIRPIEDPDHAAMSPWLAALIGAGAGLAVVGITHLGRNIRAFAKMNREFGTVLGPLSTGTIALLALTSSIGEELLFRGALQPAIGFWPTAILFGVLHGGGAPRLFIWTVFAFLTGLMLGALAIVTGSLLAPILAHLTINYWNLHALVADAPHDRPMVPREPDDPDLRGPS